MAADLEFQTRNNQLCDEKRRSSRFDVVKRRSWEEGRKCITCASRGQENTHSMASPPLIVASGFGTVLSQSFALLLSLVSSCPLRGSSLW